ncbi:MAG TPA: hypothetical protein VE818_08360 [Nitrososphaeraceae archaeon]|nr:hypothetical protein [Nitrososphaeraceae archaeon]
MIRDSYMYAFNVKESLISHEKYAVLFIFSIASLIRIVPELIAYPYPIGYDVINYYIPVVTNFDKFWSTISAQFPFYVSLLHVINTGLSISPHFVVTTFAIITYGIFGISIFFIGRRILKIDISYSMYLAFFIIFQLTVLRTTWDLHRDLFSLSTMFLMFSLVYKRKQTNKRIIIAALILSAITAMSDRMVGLLCTISLLIYTFTDKSRLTILCSVVCTFFFAASLIYGYGALYSNTIESLKSLPQTISPTFYNPTNLLILFLVYNGLVTPVGIIGFKLAKNKLLKIPLLISVTGAFSWLIFQNLEVLLADRWIILCGIFLSIFAGYGIIQLAQKKNTIVAKTLAASFLCTVVAIGIIYAVMPYDGFSVYGIVGKYIQNFVPLTMQFNSLDISDNDNLIDLISWINKNTDPNSLIIGAKHWRGWMEIKLQDKRVYLSSDNVYGLYGSLANKHTNLYMITTSGIQQQPSETKFSNIQMVYSDHLFNLFRIK